MIVKAENFAADIGELDRKIEYLRLIGLDAYWVAETNMLVIGGLVCTK